MTVDVQALINKNAARWQACHLRPQHAKQMQGIARLLEGGIRRYQAVATLTHIRWELIACLHERESSCNWNTQLAQGWPLNSQSKIIPHTGPFPDWETAAVSALVNDPIAVFAAPLAKWRDWSPGGILTAAELWNGPGYAMRSLPSPYIWSFTDQYVEGKYVRDGVWNPSFVDPQSGIASMFIALGVNLK